MPINIIYPLGFSYEYDICTRMIVRDEFDGYNFRNNVKNVLRNEFSDLLSKEYSAVRNKFCDDLAAKYRDYDNQLRNAVDSQVAKLVKDNDKFNDLRISIENRIDRNVDKYIETKFKDLNNEIVSLKKQQSESNAFWGVSLIMSMGIVYGLCRR